MGFAVEPSWRLQFEETSPITHSEAIRVQHMQKIVSRVTRLAKCMQEDEQVDSTGMLILGHEYQVQWNQESRPMEHLSLLLLIIQYTVSAGVLVHLELWRGAFTDLPRNTWIDVASTTCATRSNKDGSPTAQQGNE